MTAAPGAPQAGVSTSPGLTVDVAAPQGRRSGPRRSPEDAGHGRRQDLTRLLGTVTALAAVPAAGVVGILAAGPRGCIAGAGAVGVAVLYGEHSARYPRRRMPSPAPRPAVCARCAATQVDVVTATVRRFPPRLLLQAWCVVCWTGPQPAARDVVWWLPASFSGSWDDVDDLVDELLPLACSDCAGRHGPVGIAAWAEDDGAELLLCLPCARGRAGSQQGERMTAAHLGGVARTTDQLRALVAAALVVREPLFDVAGATTGGTRARGGDSR